jgi:hypothetical protein
MEINAGKAPLLTSGQIDDGRHVVTRFLTNQEARTIADQWQSSGNIGSAMAQLASTGRVSAAELLDDIVATMVDVSMHRNATNYRDLCDLYAWAVMMAHHGTGTTERYLNIPR